MGALDFASEVRNSYLPDFEFHQEVACKETNSQGKRNDSQAGATTRLKIFIGLGRQFS